jgi:hypothetical protein
MTLIELGRGSGMIRVVRLLLQRLDHFQRKAKRLHESGGRKWATSQPPDRHDFSRCWPSGEIRYESAGRKFDLYSAGQNSIGSRGIEIYERGGIGISEWRQDWLTGIGYERLLGLYESSNTTLGNSVQSSI